MVGEPRMYDTQIEMKGSPAVGTSDEDGRSCTLTTTHPDGGLKSVCTHGPESVRFSSQTRSTPRAW